MFINEERNYFIDSDVSLDVIDDEEGTIYRVCMFTEGTNMIAFTRDELKSLKNILSEIDL